MDLAVALAAEHWPETDPDDAWRLAHKGAATGETADVKPGMNKAPGLKHGPPTFFLKFNT